MIEYNAYKIRGIKSSRIGICPVKNGFLDKKCISVTDDTAVHRPYVFVTRTKRGKKAAIRNGTPLFLRRK